MFSNSSLLRFTFYLLAIFRFVGAKFGDVSAFFNGIFCLNNLSNIMGGDGFCSTRLRLPAGPFKTGWHLQAEGVSDYSHAPIKPCSAFYAFGRTCFLSLRVHVTPAVRGALGLLLLSYYATLTAKGRKAVLSGAPSGFYL